MIPKRAAITASPESGKRRTASRRVTRAPGVGFPGHWTLEAYCVTALPTLGELTLMETLFPTAVAVEETIGLTAARLW